MIDAIGHVAYASLVAGQWLVTRHKAVGWAIRAVGSSTWIGLGFAMGYSSIIVWSAVFLTIDLIGWQRWRSRATLVETDDS